MNVFYKRFTKASSNDLRRHLKAERGDYEMLMEHTKVLVDACGRVTPKDMILYEEDVYDIVLAIKEKKGRI